METSVLDSNISAASTRARARLRWPLSRRLEGQSPPGDTGSPIGIGLRIQGESERCGSVRGWQSSDHPSRPSPKVLRAGTGATSFGGGDRANLVASCLERWRGRVISRRQFSLRRRRGAPIRLRGQAFRGWWEEKCWLHRMLEGRSWLCGRRRTSRNGLPSLCT